MHDLDKMAGDTSFRTWNLTQFDGLTLYVRISSSSAYLFAYYVPKYLEIAPPAVMPALTLNKKYPLDINNPYITVMVYSDGGPSDYTIEYGRVDERDFLVSSSLTLTIVSTTILSIIVLFYSIFTI